MLAPAIPEVQLKRQYHIIGSHTNAWRRCYQTGEARWRLIEAVEIPDLPTRVVTKSACFSGPRQTQCHILLGISRAQW